MKKNKFICIFWNKYWHYAISLRWFVCALIALFLFMILKFYVFDIVKINSNDMNATFYNGDVTLIKKASIQFNTNDIVYFEYPLHDSSGSKAMCMQRLIGLPGDTIQIIEKGVYINNFLITDSATIKHNYYLKTNNGKLNTAFKIKYELNEGGAISANNDYNYALTKKQVVELKNQSVIKSVELKTEPKEVFDEAVFPYSYHYEWNRDYFGKLYLPKKNDVLLLDTINIKLYSLLIKDYEKNKLEIKNDSIFINDTLKKNYQVKQNYYFVLGDNRDNANDSRVFGFLPENYIKGKVIAVLKRCK